MGSTSSTSAEADIVTTLELKSIYQAAGGQSISAADAVRILESILSRDSSEDLTISEIRSALEALRDLINVNTKEILNLNTLLAKLIFALIEQGVKIQDKELLNELKIYLK